MTAAFLWIYSCFLALPAAQQACPGHRSWEILKNDQEPQNIGISHADTLSFAYSAARFGR